MDDRHCPDANRVPHLARGAEHGVRPSRCGTTASCPCEVQPGTGRVPIDVDNSLGRYSLRCLLERQGHHVDVAAAGLEVVRVGVSRSHDAAVSPPEGADPRRKSRAPNLYPDLFRRHAANPILTARDWPYPAHTVFNAGACQVGKETVLLVRVEDRRGHSHLTVARSLDGISNWLVDLKPSFVPDPSNHPAEAWGVEDPRLTSSTPGCLHARDG